VQEGVDVGVVDARRLISPDDLRLQYVENL
jgi:hypothetical protein